VGDIITETHETVKNPDQKDLALSSPRGKAQGTGPVLASSGQQNTRHHTKVVCSEWEVVERYSILIAFLLNSGF